MAALQPEREPTPPSDPPASLGGAVLGGPALDELLQHVVELGRLTIGGAHSVSITVSQDGGFHTCSSTDQTAVRIDEAQYEGGDGPCLAAIRESRRVQLAMDAVAGRWPAVARRAEESGIGAVMSTPIVAGAGDAIGALNVYAAEREPFTEDAAHTASLIGQVTSVLLRNAVALADATTRNDQLRVALESRQVIGEAKGILMEREGCTRDEAFDILRRASQRQNRKLRELAEELVLRVEARRRNGRSAP
jgi:GAF domain-containing protein